jgi:hypothetical protein
MAVRHGKTSGVWNLYCALCLSAKLAKNRGLQNAQKTETQARNAHFPEREKPKKTEE